MKIPHGINITTCKVLAMADHPNDAVIAVVGIIGKFVIIGVEYAEALKQSFFTPQTITEIKELF